jgi:hypothetical protein
MVRVRRVIWHRGPWSCGWVGSSRRMMGEEEVIITSTTHLLYIGRNNSQDSIGGLPKVLIPLMFSISWFFFDI